MEQLLQLFSIFLDPQNQDPDSSGKQIISISLNSMDLLIGIIQNSNEFRRSAVVFFKRVVNLKFNKMVDQEKEMISNFILYVLIPIIIPQDPIFLSPIIADIFDFISKELQFSKEFIFGYLNSLNPLLNYFIILFLNKIEPILEFHQFVTNAINVALESSIKECILVSLSLFTSYLISFRSQEFFSTFIGRFVSLSAEQPSSLFWGYLIDLPFEFSVPFLETSFLLLQNEQNEFDLRVSCFQFIISHFKPEMFSTIQMLQLQLLQFQLIFINETDDIDPSLFFLYQRMFEYSELRIPGFNIIKDNTLPLIQSGNPPLQVFGLYSLAYLIDNVPDLSHEILNDLEFLHPFLQSNNILMIKASFEILEIIVGKPLASYLSFESIFNDIIELLINGNEFIRNKAVNFSYKYSHSNFVDISWIFNKFVSILNLVKITEISPIFEIIADSISICPHFIPDEQIDILINIIAEVLNSKRDISIRISAAYLLCSLFQNDADMCFSIANVAIGTLFQALTSQNKALRKTMSIGLIKFIKCTFGKYNNSLIPFYQDLIFYSVRDSKLSTSYEPLLLSEIFKTSSQNIPGKENFINLLLNIITQHKLLKQYKIASLCIKKIIWQFPLEIQIQLTQTICNSLFLDESKALFKYNILMLRSMLKERSPLENRVQISQQIMPIFQSFSSEIFTNFIGSLCSLCTFMIKAFQTEIPENIKMFLNQLFIKTKENPLYYSHYTFFIFSECFKQNLIEINMAQQLINDAFVILQKVRSNLDASSSLLCIKEAIFKSINFLNEEKMNILIQFWISIQENSAMNQSKSYLSCLLFYLGINNVINNEIFISAIRNFPTSIKIVTHEICDLLINNAPKFDSFDPQIKFELLKGIIRLLSVGKSIRYCHKINSDYIIWLIKFALHVANDLKCDLGLVITETLPNSPRKQNVVKTFFMSVMCS